MLRIHIETCPGFTTLRLEGKLIRPWTEELLDAWSRLKGGPQGGGIRIDLDAVSFVDEHGKQALGSLHRAGCELGGTGLFISSLIEEAKGHENA